MFKFAYRHPVIFEVILFIGGLILTVFFMIPVQAVTYASTEISSEPGKAGGLPGPVSDLYRAFSDRKGSLRAFLSCCRPCSLPSGTYSTAL